MTIPLDSAVLGGYICIMVQVCKSCCEGESAEEARKALDEVLTSGLFKALADPTRVAILVALLDGDESTVGEVAQCCPVDFSVVSRHLGVLREAGVVESRKTGREVRYRPHVTALVDSLRALADSLERCCPREEV
jgi:ArsR family transcriptional regulator